MPGRGCNISCTSFKIFASSKLRDLSNLGTISFIPLCSKATSFAASTLAACVKSIPKRWASNPAFVPAKEGFNPYNAFSTEAIIPPSFHLSNPKVAGSLNFFTPLPAPVIPKLNNAPSVPNFILLVNLRKASALPSLLSVSIIVIAKGSKEVPFNISPSVPISSSETKDSPTPLPIIPPARGVVKTSCPLWIIWPNLDNETALPAFFAAKARLAKLAARKLLAAFTPSVAPLIATGPIEAKAWVILPIPLASATSSKGFKVSKNFSTSSAVSVPNPKSRSSAPNETIPSGIFIKPEAIPAAAEVKKPVSSAFLLLLAALAP